MTSFEVNIPLSFKKHNVKQKIVSLKNVTHLYIPKFVQVANKCFDK